MLKVSLLALAAGRAAGLQVGAAARAVRTRVSMPSMSFFDFSAKTLDGKTLKMSDLKGKPVLILNVASL